MGIVAHNFSHICTRVKALVRCGNFVQNFVLAQYLVSELIEFDKKKLCALILTRSNLGLLSEL